MNKQPPREYRRLPRQLGQLAGVLLTTALIFSVFTLHWQMRTLQSRVADEPSSTSEESTQKESREQRAIFPEAVESIDALLAARNAAGTRKLFNALTTKASSGSLTADTGLTFRSDGELRGTLLRNDRRYFQIRGRKVHGDVEIESRLEKTAILRKAGPKGREFVETERKRLDRVVAAERKMRRRLNELVERGETAQLLEARDMRPTRIVKDGFILRRGIANAGGAVVARIAADAEEDEYRVNGSPLEEGKRLAGAVAEVLRDYDPQEELEETEERLAARLSGLIDDKGFQAYLEDRDLKVGTAEREETNIPGRVRYPLLTAEGETAGAFVLEPSEGRILLQAEQGATERTILELPVTHGLGSEAVEGHPAFLLLGNHEGLTDTIVLVQPGEETISMVSIPRDLYYEEHKINELYKARGPEGIMKAVQEITGIEIEHYVTVDLDGFSALVDALGSVPVDLEKELLDPNMQYTADGKRRMLYFSRGTHEIGGDAALALARSRSTTSDFSRARRQQSILEGIRRRIDQLSLAEAGKLYDLLQAIYEYTATDLSINEMLSYYRKYRDAGQIRHLVLSSENVLHSTYLGLHVRDMELHQAPELEEEKWGAWILRPLEDDWALISWYVDAWLSGVKPNIDQYLQGREEAEEKKADGPKETKDRND